MLGVREIESLDDRWRRYSPSRFDGGSLCSGQLPNCKMGKVGPGEGVRRIREESGLEAPV